MVPQAGFRPVVAHTEGDTAPTVLSITCDGTKGRKSTIAEVEIEGYLLHGRGVVLAKKW